MYAHIHITEMLENVKCNVEYRIKFDLFINGSCSGRGVNGGSNCATCTIVLGVVRGVPRYPKQGGRKGERSRDSLNFYI